MPEIFTEDWANAWCQELAASDAYQSAATSWDNPMVFVLEADGGVIQTDRALYLDLSRGQCRGVRLATPADVLAVPYVVAGPLEAWRSLLDRKTDPASVLLSGRLRLKKGSLFSLMPHARAAYAMLEAAMSIPSSYPS